MGTCGLVPGAWLSALQNRDFQYSFDSALADLLPVPSLSSPSHLLSIPGQTPASMRPLFVPAAGINAQGSSGCLRVSGTRLR